MPDSKVRFLAAGLGLGLAALSNVAAAEVLKKGLYG